MCGFQIAYHDIKAVAMLHHLCVQYWTTAAKKAKCMAFWEIFCEQLCQRPNREMRLAPTEYTPEYTYFEIFLVRPYAVGLIFSDFVVVGSVECLSFYFMQPWLRKAEPGIAASDEPGLSCFKYACKDERFNDVKKRSKHFHTK
jgi:hypothetical protein